MKKLSDYQGADAIELWADLLDPFMAILAEQDIKEAMRTKPKIEVAQMILKTHAAEAVKILERIDSTPVNGVNAIMRFVGVLSDLMKDESARGFFGFAVQEKTEQEYSGSATENTEES